MESNEMLKQLQAMNEVLLEMVKSQKNSMKMIVKIFIVTIACYTTILISMIGGFLWYESQFEFEDTERVVSEETITQEVSGENSEINNIEGNLYKDNAVHNEERGAN